MDQNTSQVQSMPMQSAAYQSYNAVLQDYNPNAVPQQNLQTTPVQYSNQRDWIIMIILWFFFGSFGIHRFYTKHYFIGTIYLVGSLLSFCSLSIIFWIVDLVMILTGRYDTDADGIPLKR